MNQRAVGPGFSTLNAGKSFPNFFTPCRNTRETAVKCLPHYAECGVWWYEKKYKKESSLTEEPISGAHQAPAICKQEHFLF